MHMLQQSTDPVYLNNCQPGNSTFSNLIKMQFAFTMIQEMRAFVKHYI